ncbi:MAG: fructose-bisphosphate aldolase class I [Chloroflexi bacterium]|nr:fructose-bisphosphate aldolase class I [Chloroflexota bacterium]
MNTHELVRTAQALVARKKGILAADESNPTIEKRLQSINVVATPETRRAWRQLLLTTPGINSFISGVILSDETVRQKSDGGVSFVDVLASQSIIPGVKVDKSTRPLANSPEESITEGIDGLRERLNDYRIMGARFAKWRAVFTIGPHIPTSYCLDVNAQAMARYAAICQEAGIVPIVEPEVLMDGDHDIKRCFEVTEATLYRMFDELVGQRVLLEGMLLKPNMVLSGKSGANRAGPDEAAEETLRCLRRTVPAAVPGIVFLSGGQEDYEATINLNAINRRGQDAPWQLSFSYGRGLQSTPLKAWGGDPNNVERAQQSFQHRAQVTSAAREGIYTPAMEKETKAVGSR